MKNQGLYVEHYKAILSQEGLGKSITALCKEAVKKHKIKVDPETFRIFYQRWKKRNVAKQPVIEHPKTAAPAAKQNAFSEVLNRLSPNANPLNLPQSLEAEHKPFKLPASHNDILLISDIHIPYHNIQALTAALEYGLNNPINTIIINGDLIDFYAVSRFEKDPRKRNLAHEINSTRDFLKTLRQLFPKTHIYFKLGNHDIRYEHYIINKAPDLLGLNEFNLESLLHLSDLNIVMIPDYQIIHAGKLNILHGHELGKTVFSPVNVARGLYMRAKDNAICGHSHQTSQHTEPNINGKVTGCWSIGCLSELHPDYSKYNKYNHGFARIRVFEDESFEVQNFTILHGKVR